MLRTLALLGALSVLTACALPSEVNLIPQVQSERISTPDYRQRVSHRLLWLAPEEEWHYNCLFLKPLARLDYDELKLALPNADLMNRAHFEEKRKAFRSAGHLYRQAADQGLALAYVKLGNLLIDGNGLRDPYTKGGAKLVETSARLDCAEGQHRYAELLTRGIGVRTDLVAAWSWAEMAHVQGYPESQPLQKRMEGVMSPALVALAKQKAEELRQQLDLFNRGAQGQILVECVTPGNRPAFITRMRACHAMGGTHRGEAIDYRTPPQ